MSGRLHRKATSAALGAYTGVVAFFSALPLLVLIPVSLNSKAVVRLPEDGISFQWYVNVFTSTTFPQAFVTSGLIALVSTSASLAIGSVAAWVLTRNRFRGVAAVEAFLISPLLLARIIYGVAMLILLTQAGLIRTLPGLILAHIVIVVPYVVRIVGSTLIGIPGSLEEASEVLGANQARTFLRVTVPLLLPGLAAAAIFGFITSFDEFTMSVFLTGPRTMTLPVEIFKYAELVVNPSVAAASVMMILGTLLGALLLEKTVGLERVLKT